MIPAVDMQRVLQRTLGGAVADGQDARAAGRKSLDSRAARKRRWFFRRG